MPKIRYSPEARTDLADIKAYIGEELANPSAALATVTRIAKRIRGLARFPRIGAPLSSVVDIETNYRFLVCGNYLAFYRIEDEEVYVVRILYGKRDYLTLLLGVPPQNGGGE